MLVVMMLAVLVFCGWFLRYVMAESRDREQRYAARISHLEDVIRHELFTVVKTNAETMAKVLKAADSLVTASQQVTRTLERFAAILDVRPCMLPPDVQNRLRDEARKRSVDKEGNS